MLIFINIINMTNIMNIHSLSIQKTQKIDLKPGNFLFYNTINFKNKLNFILYLCALILVEGVDDII
jgi:hypothetical protein